MASSKAFGGALICPATRTGDEWSFRQSVAGAYAPPERIRGVSGGCASFAVDGRCRTIRRRSDQIAWRRGKRRRAAQFGSPCEHHPPTAPPSSPLTVPSQSITYQTPIPHPLHNAGPRGVGRSSMASGSIGESKVTVPGIPRGFPPVRSEEADAHARSRGLAGRRRHGRGRPTCSRGSADGRYRMLPDRRRAGAGSERTDPRGR